VQSSGKRRTCRIKSLVLAERTNDTSGTQVRTA
jgi:hypothetical protein